ncbi:MAG: acylphosphatase [Candidatus Diapherotrites archaeon]
MPALHAFVFGKVQGVFYRGFVEECANQLGLGGWCKNVFDGSVEVWAEGEKGKLDKLLEALQKGPNSARVERVEAKWKESQGFRTFSVQ